MSKIEKARQLAESASEKERQDLGSQIEALRREKVSFLDEVMKMLETTRDEKDQLARELEVLRTAKLRSVDEMAATIEPLCRTLAGLADEYKEKLLELNKLMSETAKNFETKGERVVKAWSDVAGNANRAAMSMKDAGSRLEWSHYLLVALIAVMVSGLTNVFLRWVAPPTVSTTLDHHALAEQLRADLNAPPPAPPDEKSPKKSGKKR